MSKIRIILTGGGSGGHMMPLLAVGEEVWKYADEQKKEVKMKYFGDPLGYRDEFLIRRIPISKIASAKIRRYFDLRNLLDIFKFFFSLFQSFWKVYLFMPNVCFSKGGPGAISVILACRFYRIPVIIHESDSIPSMTTKISCGFAKSIEVAFSSIKDYFPGWNNIKIVGNPVRKIITRIIGAREAKQFFGFNPDLPVIFFAGGSQGSNHINDFVLVNLKKFLQKYQILHQVGVENINSYKAEYEVMSRDLLPELKSKYKFFAFFKSEIAESYQCADVFVGRAGAGQIFEIASLKIPSILIPLPDSANNHQFENAIKYEESGASLTIEQDNLIPEVLINEVDSILSNPLKMKQMEDSAEKFYIPNSARLIVEDIFSLIK
ncbi:MAG: UDP-N-acetylglucosamine--N-acetylmuramyl-(pentapeptide) pyrophosphoryl-undecaprenol N-acetylglucosamine transferase [Candidatus Pacebacteria bacterium]|nr:UDP-N-acetylglucosamine--N-acetylmuramyl-(pentapeptide) pyrophosphoryl-undecaprenol N-acetylglucosamine transferase [Candidatus Paceibacterota bacterium]